MHVFLRVCVCTCMYTHAFPPDSWKNQSSMPLGQKIMDQAPTMTKWCEVRVRFPIWHKVAKLYLDENKRDQGRAQVESSQTWLARKETILLNVLMFLFLEGILMFPFYSDKEKISHLTFSFFTDDLSYLNSLHLDHLD